MKDSKQIVDFLFEVGTLSKTPRSGFHLLGSGEQSLSEHITRVVFIGYTLALLDGEADVSKVLKMCLLHDLAETRVSDLNYVHQQYVTSDEERVIDDMVKPLPFGDDIKHTVHEYEERKSKESILAKDSDNLEWILSLKEQFDIGNTRAKEWITPAVKRLKTDVAKDLAKQILASSSDDWWFADKENEWWVSRNKNEKTD